VVVNSKIDSNSIVLGFSGKPLELLHVEKVKRFAERLASLSLLW
jgi:hypothetical protein